MRIPMDRWAPESVCIGPMPIDHGWEDSCEPSGPTRFGPVAGVPLPDLVNWVITVGPKQPRYRDPLLLESACIGTEKKVEPPLLPVEHDREIAIAPREVIIRRVAPQGAWRSFEHYPEIVPQSAVVGRADGADSWGGETRSGTKSRGLIVVPSVDSP